MTEQVIWLENIKVLLMHSVILVAACKIQLVQNMMSTMVKICLFFSNSPKRELELETNIQAMNSGKATKLVSLCKTLWVARIDALEVFLDLYPTVVHTLEVISSGSAGGWNSDSCSSANSLLTCITQFQFVISFIVTSKCLGYIKGLTISLQRYLSCIQGSQYCRKST